MTSMKKWLVLVSVLGLMLAGFAGSDRPASAAGPTMRLSVDSGSPNTTVKVTASGLEADVAIRLRWDTSTVLRSTANSRGKATLTLSVPESSAGEHTVRLNDGKSALTATFVVTPAVTVNPATVRAGQSATFALSGFASSERVALRLTLKGETRRLTTVTVSATGSTAKPVTIPGDLASGTATIEARGTTDTNATAKVKITGAVPTATLTPLRTATRQATATATRTPSPTATSPSQPSTVSIWVNPSTGNDSNSGGSRSNAVRTLDEAWTRIPRGQPLTQSYRIRLVEGTYSSGIPNYMEERYGTAGNTIIVESVDGDGKAVIQGSLNIFDVRYLTLDGLTLRTTGDVVHCEMCVHFTIKDSVLDGQGSAHETLKVNQSRFVEISGSDLSGSYENAIDFVAVQHGSITGNKIHDAEDWCMYLKGGSADFWIEGNEIYNCGTGGFTAGQGTGLQFMTAPYLTYEAEDITFIRNEIHDTDGAGMGVNGGHNIVLAENHLVRIGARSHLLEIGFGGRSCDGHPGDEGRERCGEYLEAGGWGTTAVDDGDNYVRIPNKTVTVRDNVFENPDGYQSGWQHLFIPGPYSGASQEGSNAPDPAYADDGLVITGNVIVNGDTSKPIGIGDDSGCQPSNSTCNETQLFADNDINGQ